MKKFAAFDIDGTLFRSGLYRELVFELVRSGVLDESVVTKIADKQQDWLTRRKANAFYEFEQALVVALDNSLPRIRLTDYDAAAERVIATHKDNVYVFTRDLVRQLKADGYVLLAISGSQNELVKPFAEHYGFDDCIGQHYERGQEFFTGRIVRTHIGKEVFLSQLIEKHGLNLEGSIAIGDSMGDVGMLRLVERAIAFNPEQRLREIAEQERWQIVIERKNSIYSLEADEHGTYRLAPPNR